MQIKTKNSLDALTNKSVTFKTQNYIEVDDKIVNVGDVHAIGYVNSERGRLRLTEEVGEPYRSAVLAIWGDAPTVFEEVQN